ncbi:MAG: hypothetical protein V4538_07930 [Bacteroidota bacterium]
MATKKTTPTKRKAGKAFDLKPYMIGIGLMLLAITISVGFRIHSSTKHLIPISVLALIAGLFFESRRITEKWSTILWIALGAFAFSFVAFIPGKKEYSYQLENHIEIWPYAFVVMFTIFSIAFHGDKVIPKLTEGITLLQSIAVIYWVIDYGFIETTNFFIMVLMLVGFVLALYSVFHAFTNTVLSRSGRLTLSIWSSIIMLLFAADNIYRVYQNEQIENTADISHGLYIGLQFFLLGIASIYIVQNFTMLAGFLPGKGTMFNGQYYRDLKELKSNHIKRYSDRQVSSLHSLFCVLITGLVFFLNYHYQILPRHLAIWSVFVIFPFVLMLYEYATAKKNTA